jgi:hypothetical protein
MPSEDFAEDEVFTWKSDALVFKFSIALELNFFGMVPCARGLANAEMCYYAAALDIAGCRDASTEPRQIACLLCLRVS